MLSPCSYMYVFLFFLESYTYVLFFVLKLFMYYFFYLIMKHALFHLSQKNYASSVLGACPWAAEARSPAEGARQVKNRPAELPSVQLGHPYVTARAVHQYANHMRGDRDRSQRRHVKASHLLLT